MCSTIADEQALLAYILPPDGSTVGNWAEPQLEDVYRTGQMPALPGGGKRLSGTDKAPAAV